MRGGEFAGVALDWDDARILLEFPGELREVDVGGEDFGGAVLEEAVGEAASGRAEVEADFCGGRDGKIGESAGEFEAAARGEFLLAGEFDVGAGGDGSAGFVGTRAVEADFAGKDEGASGVLGVGEAALDEEKVEANARRFGFHGNAAAEDRGAVQ